MSSPESTSDPGPTAPQPAPASTPPIPSAPAEPKELRILKNLSEGLTAAIRLHEQLTTQRIHVIVGVEGLLPEHMECASEQELVRFLLPFRGKRARVFIIHGQRWLLRSGDPWQIFDGQKYIPMVLEGDARDAALITDGSMWTPNPDPLAVVPEPEEEEEGIEDDPEPQGDVLGAIIRPLARPLPGAPITPEGLSADDF